MTWAYVCGIIVCIIFSHIFSSAEMSYSSCNRMRLENARDDGSKRAKVAVKIVDNFDDSLSAILIGNNLANIANSSLGSLLVLELCNGDDSYAWVSTLTITILVIIFGETIPKIIAKSSANRLALTYAYFVRGLTIIFMPLIRLVVGLIKLLTLGLKGEAEDTDEEAAVEELSSIIETAEDEDVLDEDRSELVQAAIDFSDIMASEVMTARVDVVALDIDEDMADQIEMIENAPFSRIPVYEDSVDNVIGVLYLNHFLKALAGDEKPDIRSLLMPPCYVYKTMKLPAVLTELRKAKQHLAIVTDEYGGTLGILSMEDVLEQLVGEIWDDTDEIKEEILERSDGEFELDGDMSISDFIDLVGIRERDFEAESETVGGWTIEMFGSFPSVGDSFDYEDLHITVLEMDGLRVEKVLVVKKPPEADNEDRYGVPTVVEFETLGYEATGSATATIAVNSITDNYGVSFYASVTVTPGADCAGYYYAMIEKTAYDAAANLGETICKQNGVKYRAATEDTTFSTDYYFAESYLVLIPVDNNGKMSAPVTSELLTTSAK